MTKVCHDEILRRRFKFMIKGRSSVINLENFIFSWELRSACKSWLRRFRGFIYRRWPGVTREAHRKRMAGYARRWDCEREGFTQEGFLRIMRGRLIYPEDPTSCLELAVGDGLVGSYGNWLESRLGWKCVAWESRPAAFAQLQRNRPGTLCFPGSWAWPRDLASSDRPGLVTSRSQRQSSALCKAISGGKIRPSIVGLWNPSARAVWWRRLEACRYRLAVVHERMEFYRALVG